MTKEKTLQEALRDLKEALRDLTYNLGEQVTKIILPTWLISDCPCSP